jgi:hypothetical protein
MVERVAVLLGTVQFRLAIRIIVPENATIDDAEKAAWATIGNYPIKDWTLVDELGVGAPLTQRLCRGGPATRRDVRARRPAAGDPLGKGGLSVRPANPIDRISGYAGTCMARTPDSATEPSSQGSFIVAYKCKSKDRSTGR